MNSRRKPPKVPMLCFTLRLDQETFDRLEEIANKHRLAPSTLARLILQSELTFGDAQKKSGNVDDQ